MNQKVFDVSMHGNESLEPKIHKCVMNHIRK